MDIAIAVSTVIEELSAPDTWEVHDGRLIWNESILGPRPTEEQLAAGWQLHLKNQRRAEIVCQLDDLDRYVPRSVEELIDHDASLWEGLSTYNQERLILKEELRDELAKLG